MIGIWCNVTSTSAGPAVTAEIGYENGLFEYGLQTLHGANFTTNIGDNVGSFVTSVGAILTTLIGVVGGLNGYTFEAPAGAIDTTSIGFDEFLFGAPRGVNRKTNCFTSTIAFTTITTIRRTTYLFNNTFQ